MNFFALLDSINAVMLGVPTLVALLSVGVIFTIWSRFGQYRSLTHGVRLLRGQVPGVSGQGPGALSHFQALSAALSATVGLGNIGGVAIAVSLGGPGAVFWMWMVGIAGMALKSAEVTISLLYRNTENPDDPHGGTMWACRKGFAEVAPGLATVGAVAGLLFTLPLILFGITGGNMFQAWNVAELTRAYFGVPTWLTGLVMAAVVGAVIIGGIRRIGTVAGVLVPLMCGVYVLCSIGVLIANAERVPEALSLIFTGAFSPTEGVGAFTGATMGMAFIFGMRRALFSSESGIGSAPIAHSAVRTPEPVTEGVVAGLEPFIDTLVVCTMTALVILVSGVWNRGPTAAWYAEPAMVEVTPGQWQPSTGMLPESDARWTTGDQVFVVVEKAPGERTKLFGTIIESDQAQSVAWRPLASADAPKLAENGIFVDYPAATLTAFAFDSAFSGLGMWMVTLTVWLFAISTMITWSYYAEQGVVYLVGERWVRPYRWAWVALIVVTCLGFIRTDAEIDTISTVALGFMLAINLPTMLILGPRAMRAWHDYFRRLRSGQLGRGG